MEQMERMDTRHYMIIYQIILMELLLMIKFYITQTFNQKLKYKLFNDSFIS
jgi:hypothetical protein